MTIPTLKFLCLTKEFYAALVEDLKLATSSIRVEMYIVDQGKVTEEITKVLVQKAMEGVRVDLLYDSFGSMNIGEEAPLGVRRAGGRAVVYNPISRYFLKGVFPIGRLFRRDHRKLVVIDDQIYYVGGMNIGDRFLEWEDIMIRGEGAPAEKLARSFDEILQNPRPSLLDNVKMLTSKRKTDGAEIEVCDCRPKKGSFPAKRLYLAAIKKAKYRVWIAQAYFLPRRKLLKALKKAAARGVDVRIMIPDRPDVKIVDYATWVPVKKLLTKNVKVFRYTGGAIHTKMAVIDDHFLTAGGVNLDSMSMYWNLELNLVIHTEAFVSEGASIFTNYLERAREVNKNEVDGRSLIQKAVSRILYAFSWIL